MEFQNDGVNLQEIQEQSWKQIETASKPSGSAAVIKLFYFLLYIRLDLPPPIPRI